MHEAEKTFFLERVSWKVCVERCENEKKYWKIQFKVFPREALESVRMEIEKVPSNLLGDLKGMKRGVKRIK